MRRSFWLVEIIFFIDYSCRAAEALRGWVMSTFFYQNSLITNYVFFIQMVKVFKHHKTQFDESCVYYLVGVVKHYFQASSFPHPDIVFHFLCKADSSYNLFLQSDTHQHFHCFCSISTFQMMMAGFYISNDFLKDFAVVALSYHSTPWQCHFNLLLKSIQSMWIIRKHHLMFEMDVVTRWVGRDWVVDH